MSIDKTSLQIDVIALDLEATLISDVFSQIPRPGLYDFLEFCHNSFERVVIFTAVTDERFRQVARQLIDGGYAPAWFADIEYIAWDRNVKDLRFVPNALMERILLVDDYPAYIHPDQLKNWIEIMPFESPYLDTDQELTRTKTLIISNYLCKA